MWSSGPASHGQFSGNGWREQVMTRQPVAEKRFTVAWPMPRLAPVSSRARRGWLSWGVVIGGLEPQFSLWVIQGFRDTAASCARAPGLPRGGTRSDRAADRADPARIR